MTARSPALTALLARYGIEPCDPDCVLGDAPADGYPCRCALNPFRVGKLAAIIRELDQRVPATAEQFVERVAGDCKATEQETAEQIAAYMVDEYGDDETAIGRFACRIADDVRAGRWKERG